MKTTINNMNNHRIANNLTPQNPTHPGEIIREEIEYRGISQKKLSEHMCIAYTQLNELLNGKRTLNTEMALLIEAALEIDAEPLLVMQARYDMMMARQNQSFIKKLEAVQKASTVL